MYNKLSRFENRTFDGGDANPLIKIFNGHLKYEDDFHFVIKLDENNYLVSFFWHDKQMFEDCILFGDLVVFYMIYRTNKYGMICVLFVGMNHHSMNVIFCHGFFMNRKIRQFDWLFNTFLKWMDGKHLVNMTTDQAFSMTIAIKAVF